LPWVLGFYLALKLGELLVTEELGLLMTSGKYSFLFWTELIVGAIIPIILFSIKQVRWSRTGTLIGALFVAAGIVINRFNATWFALKPLEGVTYSPSWIELALLVGVASGVLLVFTLISTFFPVFVETVDTRSLKQEKASSPQPAPALSGD
jgi:Ni/Fe-hydrogenase subunit HybB-like protein